MTIKDLKNKIEKLPDDMMVCGMTSNGEVCPIGCFVISEDTLTDEEIRDGYPLGVNPTFIISID